MDTTVELAVDLFGDIQGRPPVVLLGALGSHRRIWNDVAGRLVRQGFGVVAADLRGLGESPVPDGPYRVEDLAADVLHVMDRRGVSRAHVVGLSIGGAVAMSLAVRAPDRVATLALLSTLPRFGTAQTWACRAAAVRESGTAPLAGGIRGRWITDGFAEENPATLADLEAMVAGTRPEGYAGCAEALGDWDARGSESRISAPTLVLGGAEDPSVTPEALTDLAVAIGGAEHVTLRQTAHLTPVERPDEVADHLIRHIGAHHRAGVASVPHPVAGR